MLSKTHFAIIAIAACYISYVALTKADGIVFASVIAALSGLGGYSLKKKIKVG